VFEGGSLATDNFFSVWNLRFNDLTMVISCCYKPFVQRFSPENKPQEQITQNITSSSEL